MLLPFVGSTRYKGRQHKETCTNSNPLPIFVSKNWAFVFASHWHQFNTHPILANGLGMCRSAGGAERYPELSRMLSTGCCFFRSQTVTLPPTVQDARMCCTLRFQLMLAISPPAPWLRFRLCVTQHGILAQNTRSFFCLEDMVSILPRPLLKTHRTLLGTNQVSSSPSLSSAAPLWVI